MKCTCAHLKTPQFWKAVIFWISALLALSVVALNCYDCLQRYLLKYTGTSDLYKHTSEVPFPDLTFCPVSRYKENLLKANGLPNISAYTDQAQWTSNLDKNPEEFYHEVTFGLEEIIESVEVHLDRYFQGAEMITLIVNSTTGVSPCQNIDKIDKKVFLTREYYFNGNCYSLGMLDCLHLAGPLEVIISLKLDVDVFIHHPGQIMSPNSRSRVRILPNREVKVSVTHETVQMLDDFGTCTNTFPEGSYDNCVYQQLTSRMLKEIGCTVPWVPDKSQICTEPVQAVKALEFYHKNRRNQEDICKNSCQFTNVYLGPAVEEIERRKTRAVFYFRRDIKESSEYLVYQELSLLAESGGIVGLILGVSLFHVRFIFYYVIDYWCCSRSEE